MIASRVLLDIFPGASSAGSKRRKILLALCGLGYSHTLVGHKRRRRITFRMTTHLHRSIHLLLCFFLYLEGTTSQDNDTIETFSWPWTWECDGERCLKKLAGNDTVMQSLNSCRLVCGPNRTLWPIPTGQLLLGHSLISFHPKNIEMTSFGQNDATRSILKEAGDIFLSNLPSVRSNLIRAVDGVTGNNQTRGNSSSTGQKMAFANARAAKVTIQTAVVNPIESLTMSTDESYYLEVNSIHSKDMAKVIVKIQANNYYGARHGLETLSQLIDVDEYSGYLQIVESVLIEDSPAYPHRGIMLDTSRNYLSMDTLYRTVDAMSYNKLNVLHWHITDTHSWPLMLNREPRLAQYGAYSPKKVYDRVTIQKFLDYAKRRGVRVIPEIDAPAHSGNGYQFGEKAGLGALAVCVNKEPWAEFCVEPPCGQLNVVNENLYGVIESLYADITNLFQTDMYHMGGDEVNFHCWNTSNEITDWMQANGKASRTEDDFVDIWGTYQKRAEEIVFKVNSGKRVPIILWTSDHLTSKKYINKYLNSSNHIIQIWTKKTDPAIKDLLDSNFKVIFSNYDALYFDCGFGAWVGEGNNWCSPYIGWQKVYNNSLRRIVQDLMGENATKAQDLVLGAEAPLWTEQTDDSAVDDRLWPRAAALAERLWSDPETGWRDAESRMLYQRRRMVQRGIKAERLQPEWCFQNTGFCYA